MTIRATLMVTALATAISLWSASAEADCASLTCNASEMQWSSSGNPGRLVLNTTESTYGNIGIGLRYNGAAKWSVATVNTGSLDIPVNVFQIYNDQTGSLGMQLDPNGSASMRDIRPQADATYRLGVSGGKWLEVWAQDGTINTSDARLKKDVADLRQGLEDVLKLRPVTFKWKQGGDDVTHIGLIAQEVEKVIPAVVKHGRVPTEPLGMNYSELIPVLVKAVQSQEQTIRTQAERISKLEKSSGVASNPSTPQVIGAGVALAAVPGIGLVVLRSRRRRRN